MEADTIPGYKIIQVLGKGSTGTVYLAIRETDQLDVIVKKIPREKAAKAKREILIMREIGCDHMNIACMIDYDFDHTVMRDSLVIYDYIRDAKPLDTYKPASLTNALHLCYQIAEAVNILHEKGIYHRDIKCPNILYKGDIPILIDFDLACMVDNEKLVCEDRIVGTPNYLSPEIIRYGQKKLPITEDIWRSSDIYSMGVVFYYVFNRRLPYIAKNAAELYRMKVVSDPKPSNSGDLSVDKLIMRIIDPDPEARPKPIEIMEYLKYMIYKL